MNVLIIGAGAIGIALGAALSQSGAAVSFYASDATKKAIEQGGIRRTGIFGGLSIPSSRLSLHTSYKTLPAGAFDFVLICAKTLSNDEISRSLAARKDCLKPAGKLVIVQNGWGNDIPYLRYFPKETVYSCRVITGFRRTALNESEVTVHTAPLLFGSLFGYDSACMAPLATALSQGGLPAEPTDQVDKALLAKLLYNTTLNPLGAVLNVNYGKLAEVPESKAIMDDLIEETFSVLQAAGLNTFWTDAEEYKAVFYGKLVPDTYDHRSSTLQDIEKQQKTEIDTLTGCILRLAKSNHVPAPTHTMLYRLIKSLEAQF